MTPAPSMPTSGPTGGTRASTRQTPFTRFGIGKMAPGARPGGLPKHVRGVTKKPPGARVLVLVAGEYFRFKREKTPPRPRALVLVLVAPTSSPAPVSW